MAPVRGAREAVEGEGQVVVFLGTEVVLHKDRRGGSKGDGAGGTGRGGCGSPTWETEGREANVANVQSWKRGSRSCLTVVAEPWESQSAVAHMV